MSALRGNPSIEEVRAQLRTFEPLLITGGDGERDSDDDTDDNDVDDDTDETDDDDSDNDGDDNDDDDEDEDEDDKSKSKSKGKKKEPTAEELLDEERRKNVQLQKQINKNKTIADKQKADKDVTKDRDRLKGENDKLREMMDDNLLEWAIGRNKKYEWENVDDVQAFIKTDSISIDLDNKKVDGLDLELKRIAKEKPYLLKKKEKEDDKDDKDLPPSGSHPRNGKTSSDDKEQQRLGQKYKIPGYGTQTLRAL